MARILFTGASSFSGLHLIIALSRAGHKVIASCTKPSHAYQEIRLQRLEILNSYCHLVYEVSFGTPSFLQLIAENPVDIFCHHAGYTNNYKSFDYDIHTAFSSQTHNLLLVLQTLQKQGLQCVIVTSSIFEGDHCIIKGGFAPFSPYGLIKKHIFESFALYGQHLGIPVHRFIIPNPFGAYDNPQKLPTYLYMQWFQNYIVEVQTPQYIRDNICVELLAKVYQNWLESLPSHSQNQVLAPSGRVSSMKDFVGWLANIFQQHFGWSCKYYCKPQIHFPQPLLLINPTPAQKLVSWNEDLSIHNLINFFDQK